MSVSMSKVSSLIEALRLAWMLAKRDLKNRYASSYAGVAWNIGVPLLYALINVIVFSVLMNGRMGAQYGNVPFALFYFVPFTFWSFFSEVVARSTGILREYGYLVNKIAFPFWVLPLVPIASAMLGQIVLFALIGGLFVHHGIMPAHTAPVFIAVWLIGAIITMGVAFIVSALSVYIADLVQIVPVLLNIVFWLTPILYPVSLIDSYGSPWIKVVIKDINPFFYLAETARSAMFGAAAISWHQLGMMLLVAGLLMVAGLLVFRKLKSGFADVL